MESLDIAFVTPSGTDTDISDPAARLPAAHLPVRALKLSPDALSEQWHAWRAGISYEVAYWSRWIAQRGGPDATDFKRRTDPATQVDHFLEDLLARLKMPVVRLLDVGAGPICCLGKVAQHARLDIVAVDPLADFYDDLLSGAGLEPLVRTQFGLGEDLGLKFGAGAFDIVHCQNAMDHSLDPARVALQMLLVCRIGGFVMLRHAHNEAEHENYAGFHRWNLTNEGSSFIVWDKQGQTDLSREFASFARSEILLTEGYLINVFEKTAEVPAAWFAQDGLRQANFQRAVLRMLGSPE